MLVLLHCRHCDAKERCAVVGSLAICATCVRMAAQDFAEDARMQRRKEQEQLRGSEPPKKGA